MTSLPRALAPICANGMCDRTAVASLYFHGSLLVRNDHLHRQERADRWRCPECLHADLDDWITGDLPADAAPDVEWECNA